PAKIGIEIGTGDRGRGPGRLVLKIGSRSVPKIRVEVGTDSRADAGDEGAQAAGRAHPGLGEGGRYLPLAWQGIADPSARWAPSRAPRRGSLGNRRSRPTGGEGGACRVFQNPLRGVALDPLGNCAPTLHTARDLRQSTKDPLLELPFW